MLALKTENQQLPQNPCPIALLLKEKSGLANHPLSCHPQRGCLAAEKMRERKRKMREEGSSGKTPASLYIPAKAKNQDCSTRFPLSLYSAQISKNTKIPSIPIMHEGKNWKKKKLKKGSQTGVKRAKNKKNAEAFSHSAKFRTMRKFAPFCKATQFSSFSLSSFLLVSDLPC